MENYSKSELRKKFANDRRMNSSQNFLRRTEIPPTRFGRNAMGDPRFVFDLRKGRDPRPETVERVRAFLDAAQC